RDGVGGGRWVFVVEEQWLPGLAQVPGEVVGERAEEDVRFDAVFEAVVDRAQLEWAFEGAEGALDLFELFVGADDLGRFEFAVGDAGAEQVDAVEGRLGRDLVLLAREDEAGIGDLELEVLSDAPAVPDRADGEPDLGLALERALLDAGLDLGERALGGLQQVVAFA